MLAAIVLLVLTGLTDPSPDTDTVLVKDAVAVASSDETPVLGWRRVPADSLPAGAEGVPDAALDLLDVVPGDGLYADQWGLPRIGAPWAWDHTTGSGIVVAVVDSGIDVHHRDLAGRLFTNPGEVAGNGVDDDGNGYVDDIHGWDIVDDDSDVSDPAIPHGTQVASVALGTRNGFGLVGAAPSAVLLPVRACRTQCQLLDVAAAIVYATEVGADVINLSIGGQAEAGPLADAVDYAEDAGVVVVAAAGNGGDDIDDGGFVPAGLPNANLISVAATDRSDRLWPGSNTGISLVDVGAPGVEVVTAVPAPPDGPSVGTGTSFSAPHAAAVAALVLSVADHLGPEAVIDLIARHGDPTAELSETTRHGVRIRADRSVAAARLDDIAASLFDREIAWLYVAGITQGCASTSFCPEDPITRGEMAAFLTRALDLPPGSDAFTDDAFTDDDSTVFEADIDSLASAGITTGCGPTSFCPHDPVTRGQMAAFLRRALG